MGKRKIGKKTRLNRQKQKDITEDPFTLKQPHSIIISRGKVGKNTQQLIENFKKVMDPYTAKNVKVQKTNKLKDFISIAPTFNVTHVIAFNKTETNLNMRIIRVPRGPTLWFKVSQYVLMKDIQTSLKRPITDQNLNLESALCVMNNFEKSKKHSKLVKTFIQSMFPTTNIPTLKLDNVRRVAIWNWNMEDESIDFRHYVISVAPSGCSQKIKQLLQASSSSTRQIPNIGDVEDIAEFIKDEAINDGDEIKTENEDDVDVDDSKRRKTTGTRTDNGDGTAPVKVKLETTDDERGQSHDFSENEEASNVNLAQNMKNSRGGNIANEKSKIILTEYGPRLSLNLIKVQAGVNDGEVIYHNFIEKSEEEVLKLQKKKNERVDLKKERRAVQEANVRKKEAVKEANKERSLEGMRKKREKDLEGQSQNQDDDDTDDDGIKEEDEEQGEEEEVSKDVKVSESEESGSGENSESE